VSGVHRSNHITLLQLQDDGRARIDCPLKGVMAIARCRDFQRDTAASGKSCRCSVYEAYRGGEANGELDPALNEELCGRVVTKSLDEEIAELQTRNRSVRAVGTLKRAHIAPGARSLDAEIAALQKTSNQAPPRSSGDNKEGNDMANHPRQAARCTLCSKPSPEGTKVFGGLCKPCRDKRDAREAGAAKPPTTIEKIVEKHLPQAPPTVATVLDSPKERQQMMQPIVQADLDRLAREVKGLTRTLNKVKWLAQGVLEGYIPLERLVEVGQAIEKAQG
jgi:hypothetical protein